MEDATDVGAMTKAQSRHIDQPGAVTDTAEKETDEFWLHHHGLYACNRQCSARSNRLDVGELAGGVQSLNR
jgi:hypothetical protein